MKIRLIRQPPPGYDQATRRPGWLQTRPPLAVSIVGEPMPKGYRVIVLDDPAFERPGQWAVARGEYVGFERPETPQYEQPQTEAPRQPAPRQQLTLF